MAIKNAVNLVIIFGKFFVDTRPHLEQVLTRLAEQVKDSKVKKGNAEEYQTPSDPTGINSSSNSKKEGGK